jgi:Flp pilus assembly protein TadG
MRQVIKPSSARYEQLLSKQHRHLLLRLPSVVQGRGAPQRVSRRRGFVALYVALSLAGFLGITGLVVDMGNLYTRRAQAQRAADAAALAGAYELNKDTTKSDTGRQADASQVARQYAQENGYGNEPAGRKGTVDVSFSTTSTSTTETTTTTTNRIQVKVQRQEPLYFLPAFFALLPETNIQTISVVGATAIAEVTAEHIAPIPVNFGGGQYGTSDGVANPSIFGPHAEYQHGDPFSPQYLQDGRPNNETEHGPSGTAFNGYEYTLTIDSNYASLNGTDEVQLEIFDPECYSQNYLEGWDEIRDPNPNIPNAGPVPTTTEYTIIAPDGNTIVGSAVYGEDPESNLLWTSHPALKFSSGAYGGPGKYTVRVRALSGSSENGFQFRAGKPHEGLRSKADEEQWRQEYNNNGTGNGTQISANGKVPMNFTVDGLVTINLGFIEGRAAGGVLTVNKFDTDVGFQNITYKIDKTGQTFSSDQKEGINGRWTEPDVLPIPRDYPTEGSTWSVSYLAGRGDTSVWTMDWTKAGVPGTGTSSVRLVG